MRLSARAAIAVAMLVGIHLLALLLVAALVVVDVLLVQDGRFIAFVWTNAVFAPIVLGVLVTLFSVGATPGDQFGGTVVTPQDQPRLWDRVRMLAAEVGTRPPDEIRVVPGANAGVVERTRLFGLVVRRRVMVVGFPLFACLTDDELTAVLAHELGHFGNHDARLGGLVHSGRAALVRILAGLSGGTGYRAAVAEVIAAYANLYLTVSGRVSRRQELAADAVAARIAGSRAAASALRAVPFVHAAWATFLEERLHAAGSAGYLPRNVLVGFTRWWTVERPDVEPAPPVAGPFDRHPPMAERIAAVEALAAPGGGGSAPAIDLLDDPSRVVDSSLSTVLTDELGFKTPVECVDLDHLLARAHLVAGSSRLLTAARRASGEREATLGTVLDLLDRGRLADLLPADLVPGNGTRAPRVVREYGRGFVIGELAALAELACRDAGRECPDLAPHVEAACEDHPDTAGLRRVVGIAPDRHPVAD
ncbi:M48 family metallopeptidase [Saccharothrix variisporea]|uniref:Zn-dependent protease with chaperone function n=1 Tax=Saccharothrix variisporea TaxID=543527 RepID=A0A495XLT2_9PSEU|nr:M48 family metallopeptidase [Saccharothrix variisporea]RKT74852.1 Zn-dependent protease with chaperone function [Saccharothrix variisporea]